MSIRKKASLAIALVIIVVVGFFGIKHLLWKQQFRTAPIPARFKWDGPILISHGGGKIKDARWGTNSKEALMNTVRENYRFVELDLLQTSDGVIFGAHDWPMFLERVGLTGHKPPLPYKEIASRKIDGKYTVLSPDQINKILTDNPHLHLVTDKIRDYDALLKQIHFPDWQERMLVECFNYEDYVKALKKGIKYPMLNLSNQRRIREMMYAIRNGYIAMITTSARTLGTAPKELEEIYKLGVTVIVLSNDLKQTRPHLGKRLSGFYAEEITPSMLKAEGL